MSEQDPIQVAIDDFLAKIRVLAAQKVHAIVDDVASRTRGNEAPVIPITKGKAAAKAKATKPRGGGSGGGGGGRKKAPPSPDVEAIMNAALDVIHTNPGSGISTIADALNMESKTLSPVMKRLLADKLVKTQGERRGTTYWPRQAAA